MKIKSAFTFFIILIVLMNIANAQLVIDANSGFYNNSSIGKEYMIVLNNPEEYSFIYDAEDESYQGEKIFEPFGKPYWKFVVIFSLWTNKGEEVRYIAPYKTGDLDYGHSNYNQAINDSEYEDDMIAIFIDKNHALHFSTLLTYTYKADYDANGLGWDEENILHGKTAKQAHQDLIKYLRKNLKITKIGDNSDNQEAPNDQSETDIQNDLQNEESLDNNETTNPISQDSSNDWVVVVGGVAALAGAMALVAKMFRARRRKSAGKPNQPEPKKANKQQKDKKKKEEEEEKFFYILQLNKDVLEIGPEKNDKLVVTAWRVDSAGNRSLAKDAAIQVLTSEQGIAINSPSGNGQCAPGISLQPNGQFNDAILTISAAVGGKTLKASAKVTCNQQLTLIVDAPTPLTFINGKKYQEALFEQQKDETDGEWVFKPFCLWFTDDPNPTIDPDRTKPVKPPFNPIFKFEAIPDVLEISTPVHHGENVWKADVKLFAEKSVDTNWLFNDGKIKITVTVDEQKLNVK